MRKICQPSIVLLGIAVVAVIVCVGAQQRRQIEIQLAGIRLGSPVIDRDPEGNLRPFCLVRVWGMPDLIITAAPTTPTTPGTMGVPTAPGMPGAPGGPGAPFGGLLGGMGSALGAQPPGMPYGSAPYGGPPSAPPYGGAPYGMPGAMPGGGAGMPGLGTPGGTAPTTELAWVQWVYIPPQGNQRLWLYRRGESALSFLEDQGIVTAIMVYGTRSDAIVTPDGRRYTVATALGDPFRAIRLGDDLQRVLLRYGPPDSARVIPEQVPVPLTNIGIGRTVLLRYSERSNVEFTVVDYKVVRIFIFLPRELQAPRTLVVPLSELPRR